MQPDLEYLALARLRTLPRPPNAHTPPRRQRRGRWRWRWRPAPVPRRPLAPDPAPAQPALLDIHEYLELEFAVGENRR